MSLKSSHRILFLCLSVLMVIVLSSCGSQRDAEKKMQIVGSWIDKETMGVSEDNDGTEYVAVFEFTEDGKQNFYKVYSDTTLSYPMDNYDIADGDLIVSTSDGEQKAKLSFEDGIMIIKNNQGSFEYRKLSNEEIAEYNIDSAQEEN